VSGSQALVNYVGTTFSDSELGRLTENWKETITAPNGDACGSSTLQPMAGGIHVLADAQCVRQFGTQAGWHVTISYADTGTTTRHDLDAYPLTGTPPGYQPCAPLGFQAGWGATISAGVSVTFGGDVTQLAGCSNFTYTLQLNGKDCGTPDANPDPPATSVIHVSGCDTSTENGWTVRVQWHNDNINDGKPLNDGVNPDLILGSPPS
jgi:hypothetical protein